MPSTILKLERQHPRTTLFQLAAFGITLLFLGIVLLYWFNTRVNYEKFNVRLLIFYSLNIIPLTLSTYFLRLSIGKFDKEQVAGVARLLLYACLSCASFCLFQLSASLLLTADPFFTDNLRSSEFFLVLVGLHIVHLVGGLAFLGTETYRAFKARVNAGEQLVYTVNTYQRMKLVMLKNYWRLMDILYLVILLRFLFRF